MNNTHLQRTFRGRVAALAFVAATSAAGVKAETVSPLEAVVQRSLESGRCANEGPRSPQSLRQLLSAAHPKLLAEFNRRGGAICATPKLNGVMVAAYDVSTETVIVPTDKRVGPRDVADIMGGVRAIEQFYAQDRVPLPEGAMVARMWGSLDFSVLPLGDPQRALARSALVPGAGR